MLCMSFLFMIVYLFCNKIVVVVVTRESFSYQQMFINVNTSALLSRLSQATVQCCSNSTKHEKIFFASFQSFAHICYKVKTYQWLSYLDKNFTSDFFATLIPLCLDIFVQGIFCLASFLASHKVIFFINLCTFYHRTSCI